MSWCSTDSLRQTERRARRDYRCAACGGVIPKGSRYLAEYGGWREHLPGGCVQQATRESTAQHDAANESATAPQLPGPGVQP